MKARPRLAIAGILTAALIVGVCASFAGDTIYGGPPDKSPPGTDYETPKVISRARLARGGLRFAVFGDWGLEGQVHGLVASGVNAFQERLKAQDASLDAVLLAGDNFYSKGVTGLDDPKWERFWGGPYRRVGVPFYVALGNHDYGLGAPNAQFQVEQSGRPGFELWRCRDDNGPDEPGVMSTEWFLSDDIACQLVIIDTNLMLLPRMRKQDLCIKQLRWLDERLDDPAPKGSEGKTLVRLVLGHHVVACFGEKELEVAFLNSDANRLGPRGTNLRDILVEKADAYLCGHAHTVEYIDLKAGAKVKPERGPLHGRTRSLEESRPIQLISGTGGSVRDSSYWDDSCYYVARLPGFTYLTLSKDRGEPVLTAHFVDCRIEGRPRLIYGLRMPLKARARAPREAH